MIETYEQTLDGGVIRVVGLDPGDPYLPDDEAPLHPLDLPSLALVEYEHDPLELEFRRLEARAAARAGE